MEMNNLTKINFTPDQDYVWGIQGLKQWDQGQKLEISGLDISDEIVEVHFSLQEFQGVAKRMVGVVKDGVIHTDIPVFVLEGPEHIYGNSDVYSAYAWIYVSDEESAETIRKMEFEIKARPKPEDYVTPEELSFLQQLEQAMRNKLDKSGYTPNKFLGTDTEGNVVEKDAPEGGDVSDEQVAQAVEEYLSENPIKVEDELVYVTIPTKGISQEIKDLVDNGKTVIGRHYLADGTYEDYHNLYLPKEQPVWYVYVFSTVAIVDGSYPTIKVWMYNHMGEWVYLETPLADKDDLNSVANKIPKKLSQLQDDVGFAYYDELPTKTSDLENDSGFVETPTTAQVGQMLVVKAVDENGVPTEWEVSDVASGGVTQEQAKALDDMFKKCAFIGDVSTEYEAFKNVFGLADSGEVEPDTPTEPDDPTITLSSISATYTGGNVVVGTSVNSLTGVTVKATYSDGSTKNVTGYTLSGTIAEGNNTITVSYQGKTTTFMVIGVVESGGEEIELDIPSTNLLAYYDMGDDLTASGKIDDRSINGYDLTIDTTKVVHDTENGILYRNGEGLANDSVASVSNVPFNDFVTAFVTVSGTNDKTVALLHFGDTASTQLITFQGGVIVYKTSGFNNVSSSTKLSSGSIQTIAFSVGITGNEKIYINGELKSNIASKVFAHKKELKLLTGYNNINSNYKIHNVAVYNGELTESEVSAISNTLLTNAGGVA